MIKRKLKICKGCGKPSYLFSGGRCKTCDARFKRENQVQNQRSPKSGYKIPLISKSRSEGLKTYSKLIKEIDREAKEKKETKCFFCWQEIEGGCDHHHLNGKENERLTEKKYIVRVHRDCHNDYHNKSVHDIPWFGDYIERLRRIDTILAELETFKLNK